MTSTTQPKVRDWSQLPAGLTRRRVLGLIDTLFELGPFGLRGPAAADVPAHLIQLDAGVRTAQVIAPGYACPSNDFLARSLDAVGDDILYITSANRSRHRTGADDEPAHWTAAGLRAEFGHEPAFRLLEHADEDAARRRYPGYALMSTTILAFHKTAGTSPRGRVRLLVERTARSRSTICARCSRGWDSSWPSRAARSVAFCNATTPTAAATASAHEPPHPDRADRAQLQYDHGDRAA
jgi:hypothetical protein